jgi:phosphoglycerate dehydrogenase-like enzyme
MNRNFETKIAIVLTMSAALLTLHPALAEEPAPQPKQRNQQVSKPMRIGVIGAGSLGGTVGSVLESWT